MLGRNAAFNVSVLGWFGCSLAVLGIAFTCDEDQAKMERAMLRNVRNNRKEGRRNGDSSGDGDGDETQWLREDSGSSGGEIEIRLEESKGDDSAIELTTIKLDHVE